MMKLFFAVGQYISRVLFNNHNFPFSAGRYPGNATASGPRRLRNWRLPTCWRLPGRALAAAVAVWLLPAAPAVVFAAGNEVTEAEEYPVKVILFPFRQAVISAEVDTEVKQYKIKEGECFKEGETIALLDDKVYLQKHEKAKSAQLEAEASLQFARKNLKRNEEMYQKGIQGMQDLEKSELERDVAVAKMNFSVANTKMAEIDLKACRLAAPFAGRLVKKLVQEHEFVRASQQVISIIDDYQLLAVMHLPSSEINKAGIGKNLRVWIDETRTEHPASIYIISGEIDPGSRTFEIKALVDNRSRKLAAGMSGKLMKSHGGGGAKK